MRDPTRIKPMLSVIGEIWEKYPDLRLGQLIMNVADKTPMYYIEDGELLSNLINFYKN